MSPISPSVSEVLEKAADLIEPEALDRPRELMVVRWEGRLHCVYLDDHRIAGGKPWGGGESAKTWTVTLRDVIRVFPELQTLAGLDYLGNPLRAAASKAREASHLTRGEAG